MRLLARWTPCCTLVMLVSLLALGCSAPAGEGVTQPLPMSVAPTTTASPASTDASAGRNDLVILLAEASAMASTYHIIWPDYQMPLFALWPDGRVLVLEKGGFGAGTPVYLEAQLGQQQIDTLRSWVAEAKISSLADTYPLPKTSKGIMLSDATELRLRVRDAGTQADVTYALGYPIDDELLPARLNTLDKRLRAYRPPDAHTYMHDDIEVVVSVQPPTQAQDLYPLRKEFSLDQMTQTFRNVDEVQYSKTFSGAEAARIATRIDAGESLYQDDAHSYWIHYRPLVEWPEP